MIINIISFDYAIDTKNLHLSGIATAVAVDSLCYSEVINSSFSSTILQLYLEITATKDFRESIEEV
jgi:hypothetical protein